jgi:hypothetical protein
MAEGQAGSKRAKGDKMAQVRVALREAERAEWIGNTYEMEHLKKQAETIRFESPVDADTEHDLIIQQLQQKAARDRHKAAGQANKLATFACPVCLDDKPLANLHVNVPCGHGFCKTCIAQPCIPPGAAAAPGTKCFSCRSNVDSVMKTYL